MTNDNPTYDDVPEYEPIGGQTWGPGIPDRDQNVPKIPAADLVDTRFAVLGFVFLPSSYEDSDQYAMIHCMDTNNTEFLFNTSSAVLMRVLKERYQMDQIPFRATLIKQRGKKSGMEFYNFI
jgi:hypothetical protein